MSRCGLGQGVDTDTDGMPEGCSVTVLTEAGDTEDWVFGLWIVHQSFGTDILYIHVQVCRSMYVKYIYICDEIVLSSL